MNADEALQVVLDEIELLCNAATQVDVPPFSTTPAERDDVAKDYIRRANALRTVYRYAQEYIQGR